MIPPTTVSWVVVACVSRAGRPGQQLHHQERDVGVGAAVEDRHHVGMLKGGRTAGLPHEAFERGAVEVGVDHLHLVPWKGSSLAVGGVQVRASQGRRGRAAESQRD